MATAPTPIFPETAPAAPAGEPAPARAAQFAGEVVYMYAFDVAYEMVRQPVRQLLGRPVEQFAVDSSKRGPRQLFFYRPQMVRLPAVQKIGPMGPIQLERSVKLLPVGAISITVRVGFRVEHLDELVVYHDLRFADGGRLYDDVRALAEEVRRELEPFYIRPVAQLGDEEAYTVFCMNAPLRTLDNSPLSAEDWMLFNRREVASLLTEERDPARLSDQEADESTGRYFSYYDDDLVVVDWDAAMIVDEPRNFDEILHIMELANVQLAEVEAYDRTLDEVIERSYRDLGGGKPRGGRATAAIQRELREIRVDMARLSDELSNTTKFFGDWHTARVYQGLAGRFHLQDWYRTIDDKLKTLDDLYQLLYAERNNRFMLLLEITIVLLFVIDLVILVLQTIK